MAESGTVIVITKNGKPIAQLAPVVLRMSTLAGAHQGKINIKGDIVGPLQQNCLAVSAISFWEVAMLIVKERIELALPPETWRRDLKRLPLSAACRFRFCARI